MLGNTYIRMIQIFQDIYTNVLFAWCLFIPFKNFFFLSRELSSTFARLCNEVDISKESLEKDIHALDLELCRLKDVSSKAKLLRYCLYV